MHNDPIFTFARYFFPSLINVSISRIGKYISLFHYLPFLLKFKKPQRRPIVVAFYIFPISIPSSPGIQVVWFTPTCVCTECIALNLSNLHWEIILLYGHVRWQHWWQIYRLDLTVDIHTAELSNNEWRLTKTNQSINRAIRSVHLVLKFCVSLTVSQCVCCVWQISVVVTNKNFGKKTLKYW